MRPWLAVPTRLETGRLIAFVGEASADLDAHRGLLETLTERVVHAGGAGAGYIVKLLANLLCFGQALMATEALALAHRARIKPQVLREAVGHSAANGFTTNEAEALLAGDNMTDYSLARICEQMTRS